MTRVMRHKLLWFAGLAVVMAVAGVLFAVTDGPAAVFVAALVLLIPGRLQRAFYRDLFAARREMAHGRYLESIPYSQRFLADVRERPGLKRLMWLAWPGGTPDAEAMALNNLAAGQLNVGEWEDAERHLKEALRIDPEYAVARFNLAILAGIRGDRAEAERLLGEARSLGFRRGSIGALMQHADELRTRPTQA